MFLSSEFITPCDLTGHQIIVRKILTSLCYFVNWVEGHIVFVFGGFKLVRYTLLYKRVSRAKWLGLLLLLLKTTETIVWTRQYTEE